MPLFRRARDAELDPTLTKVPDDLPRDTLFAQPIVVVALSATSEAVDDGRHRVTFRATVKDAEGKRCPDLYVEARLSGPERRATGAVTTDLMGQARFRMAGPAGTYRCEIDDVAAGALTLDRDASSLDTEIALA